MVKVIFILLQIAAAAVAAKANVGQKVKGFVYLGSFKSEVVQEGSKLNTGNFDENDYYVSINPTIWQSADDDCKNIFGPNSGLVAIETNEEWDFLTVMLERYGFGTTFWTSGKYDISLGWIWSLNNRTISNSNPPWLPPSNPNIVLRIRIYHTSRYDANWLPVVDTQLHRYICKVR